MRLLAYNPVDMEAATDPLSFAKTNFTRVGASISTLKSGILENLNSINENTENIAVNTGLINNQQLDSGTYTPTVTNVVNTSTITSYDLQYSRVGSVVTVSGEVDFTTPSTGNSGVNITLPVATTGMLRYECSGAGSIRSSTATQNPCSVYANTTSGNSAILQLNSLITTPVAYHFIFSYLIK